MQEWFPVDLSKLKSLSTSKATLKQFSFSPEEGGKTGVFVSFAWRIYNAFIREDDNHRSFDPSECKCSMPSLRKRLE